MSVDTRPIQKILFAVCAGNEMFFVALYLTKWVHTPLWQSFDLPVSYLTSFTWPELMAWCCSLVCLLKNVINAVQLWKASKILVGVDLAERAKARGENALRSKQS
jgi:CDP-diacylglycerol--inositol 3-phosphatidyltransferase